MRDSKVLDGLFQQAVAAIDTGDVVALERLLAEHPRLVRDRLKSPGQWLRSQIGAALDGFFKHPYLLWFVTEDAVRTGQLSANVADIARVIIQAAQTQRRDGPAAATRFNAPLHRVFANRTGRWPAARAARRARRCRRVDGWRSGSSPDLLQRCGGPALDRARGQADAAAALCLERWDDVERLGPAASATEKQIALGLAALNGKAEALARLLPLGVDLNAFTASFYTHATPLHHAVWSGSLDAVKGPRRGRSQADDEGFERSAPRRSAGRGRRVLAGRGEPRKQVPARLRPTSARRAPASDCRGRRVSIPRAAQPSDPREPRARPAARTPAPPTSPSPPRPRHS